MAYKYCNIDTKAVSGDISVLFPDWGTDEVLLVSSPHDDDAILGAGYAIQAARDAGAEVWVMIFCRGDAGYSTVEEKPDIEARRVRETDECYARLGIPADHIVRLGFPDFSAMGYWGWRRADGQFGDMPRVLRFLREKRVTRVLIPNHYHEHIDHLAAHWMTSWDVPQAGDAALVDIGEPFPVRSTLEYSVWADLDPEDALTRGRPSDLRANRILLAGEDAEKAVIRAVSAYSSQERIIEDLVRSRGGRKAPGDRYMEVYIAFDCRPKIDMKPYVAWVVENVK